MSGPIPCPACGKTAVCFCEERWQPPPMETVPPTPLPPGLQAWVESIAESAASNPAGAKHDAGKVRAGLLVKDFPHALTAVARVATFGANKYTAHSWRTVPDAAARYHDALYRHILAQASGEINDPESGLPHAAHIAWNALALLELEFRK